MRILRIAIPALYLPITAVFVRALRRDRSTICRELRLNFWHDREVPIAEAYWPVTAQRMAEDRRRRYRKLLRDPHLRAAVIEAYIIYQICFRAGDFYLK